MNAYNKQKGRWVDERTETMPQFFYKSDAQKEEDAKKATREENYEEAKDNKEEAPSKWPPCNLWEFELTNQTGQHASREVDFIDRMFDIHNH